ncbi:MAG: shikimate dehydrogenase [Pseudomonadota bacterium]
MAEAIDLRSAAATLNGRTRLFGMLGHPVDAVRAPAMFNARAARLGADAAMVALDVPPDRFERTVGALRDIGNLHGFVVTAPFKVRAMALAHTLGARASACGSLNLLVRCPNDPGRWHGDALDGLGFGTALRDSGFGCAGARVLLVGAGGVGSAIATELAAQGVLAIDIHDHDPQRAAALVRRMQATGVLANLAAPRVEPVHDLAINATPMGGRRTDDLPMDLAALQSWTTVADVVMAAHETPLVAAARAAGCRVQDGQAMLDGQFPHLYRMLLEPRHVFDTIDS